MKSPRLFLLVLLATGLLGAQEISPVFYGQNHWLADGDENRTGYLHLLWPKVKESGVQLIRIGGNAYNIQPPSRVRWTAMVDSVQAIGAEPLLQVPASFTAAQAADLVAHFNAPGRTPIRYWSIGNEPMLHDATPLADVHAYLLRIATALRAADPSIKILISDEAWLRLPAYEALCGGSLDLTGKDAAGRWLIDGFSFHSYPNGETFTRHDVVVTGGQKIRNDARQLVALLEQANLKHGRTGEARLSWALTEVNVTYANPDRDIEGFGNPSFLGGQFLAEVFGIGLEYGALTVAPWCLSETDAVKTDFGFLGLPPDFPPRSSYYHTQMMSGYLRGRFIKTASPDPLVKLIGTRTADRIAVLVMNQDQAADRTFALNLGRGDASWQADAGLPGALTVKIPAQCTRLYLLDGSGRLLRTVTYGVSENLRHLPPHHEQFPESQPSHRSRFAGSAGLWAVLLAALPGALVGQPATKPYPGVPYQDAVYQGGPQLIPGRLQNEYYDRLEVTDEEKARGAGEMVTYHDTDNKNSGSGGLNGLGSYLKEFRRFEGPDVSYVKFDNPGTPIDDSPFNFVTPDRDALYLGWIAPGEWVNYTVMVEVEGFYSLTIMYTSKFGGGFSLARDGVDVTGPITLPSTFVEADPIGWRQAHHWNRVTKAGRFFLRKGRQVLTLHFLDQPVMNFDYMEFVPAE